MTNPSKLKTQPQPPTRTRVAKNVSAVMIFVKLDHRWAPFFAKPRSSLSKYIGLQSVAARRYKRKPSFRAAVRVSQSTSLLQTYLAKRDTLLRFLTGLCGEAAMAEDVLQDMYIQINRAEIPAPVDNPLGYLFRMANNLCLNRLRAQTSHRARDSAWYDLHPQQESGADASPDAESILSRRQDLAAVMKAVDELPERTRDIFRLHKLDGVPQTEVARRFDLSLSAVEKHLGRALKHLMTLRRSSGFH